MANDFCSHCGQPWERQRHKTVKALDAFCRSCAYRKRKGMAWYAAQRQQELEKQMSRWKTWDELTPEQQAHERVLWAAMWPTE